MSSNIEDRDESLSVSNAMLQRIYPRAQKPDFPPFAPMGTNSIAPGEWIGNPNDDVQNRIESSNRQLEH